jgi:hypothetical protein
LAKKAALANELVAAKQQGLLSRVMGRWFRYELIVIDECGCADRGCGS